MQRIATTVRLNRSTVQFEDAAYQRLEAYFTEGEQRLAGNPDRQEILDDLEQAVADQCARRLPPGQSVVTLAELVSALDEIGPVQVPGAAPASERVSRDSATRDTTRRLEQVSEGAVISGVCQGLARYFGLDVTLLRIVAVLLLFGTGGGMVLVYVAAMLLLPFAPPAPGGRPVRWLPARSREFVEFLRAKLHAVAS
jgi:phage shock protein PspC (stress-responsive transcriptional regulator)